jgi:hypothetical protein
MLVDQRTSCALTAGRWAAAAVPSRQPAAGFAAGCAAARSFGCAATPLLLRLFHSPGGWRAATTRRDSARTLALLAGAGVPILKALQAAAETLGNRAMRADACAACYRRRRRREAPGQAAGAREHEHLRATYERMLEEGAERFQVKPSGLPAMEHLYDELPNFHPKCSTTSSASSRCATTAATRWRSRRCCCWARRASARRTSRARWRSCWAPAWASSR